MLSISVLSSTLSVFAADQLLFTLHDVVTVFHAAGANDCEYGWITLLHIPLLLLKYISITAGPYSFLGGPPPPSCHESQPNFISHGNDGSARQFSVWELAGRVPIFPDRQLKQRRILLIYNREPSTLSFNTTSKHTFTNTHTHHTQTISSATAEEMNGITRRNTFAKSTSFQIWFPNMSFMSKCFQTD